MPLGAGVRRASHIFLTSARVGSPAFLFAPFHVLSPRTGGRARSPTQQTGAAGVLPTWALAVPGDARAR